MFAYAIAYVSTAIVFLGIDSIWLGVIAPAFYRKHLGEMLLDQPNFVAAGLFYLIYIGGIVYFAVAPALQGGGWVQAAIAGAMLGFVAYATYDLTNWATLKNWSPAIVVADLAWGTVLTAAAATAGYFITQKIAGAA
ncbi:DUF2177 family protein [Rhizobium sp. XQZ8]|uniref:DUF2177 family protein n=1 Tax=Rhizobium populisoli TaxID=2859785 RepID=UPI001C66806C|nr:DUF2177 family protein [Rhizobium populisoli]MBW6424479.1 DUF2177 family protein [Rhizobium populisoli]